MVERIHETGRDQYLIAIHHNHVLLHEERQSSDGFIKGEGNGASVLLLQRLHHGPTRRFSGDLWCLCRSLFDLVFEMLFRHHTQ
jgi:hypothetical protein